MLSIPFSKYLKFLGQNSFTKWNISDKLSDNYTDKNNDNRPHHTIKNRGDWDMELIYHKWHNEWME